MEHIPQDKIKYFSKSIGSLVLLKPLLKRMKIAEIIDRICPANEQQLLSHGKTIEILIGNRLLSSQPIYRIEEWAKHAGIKEIYGIDSGLLNDDHLSRTLDAVNSLRGAIKSEIALHVAKSFQVPLKQIHWDLTSFHFTGEYESQNQDHIQILYTKNHPNEDAQKSVKIGLDVAKDEYGQVPIYYEDLDGKAQGTAAVISNMENLKEHLKLDHILRISDRGCFSPEVAIKTKKKHGFDLISSIDFSKSYQDLFLECASSGITWEELTYLSINQQAKKEKRDRDYYYGSETKRELEYNGEKEEIRVIFIKSDGKLKRERKTETKRIAFINKGFEGINEKIGHPHYKTTEAVEKRIKSLLSKYPDYGCLYTYEIIQNEAGKPIKAIPFVNETLLARKRMLYGVYPVRELCNKNLSREFEFSKEKLGSLTGFML